MNMSPIVNTDIRMPAKMLEALGMHETICIMTGKRFVTPESVKDFLLDRYGEKLASAFKPEYLFSTQET
jgi:hypothetical protein